MAQTSPSATSTRDAIIKGGAQLNGVAVHCGKITEAQAKESKEKARVSIYGKGGDSTGFDALYDASYNAGLAKAKAMPDNGKAACERLDELQKQGAAAAKK
ncbi:hypothetical protein [Pseudoxanthomonas sp. GM95]|uniref:hypothetical protein n=1 Tax=Pseudoxanthomonas sp. GM95 TaxID=1881043 RepID=UPI00111357D1|nr:hypothetical protein [Pseudoxanthomonas sp. GM95]